MPDFQALFDRALGALHLLGFVLLVLAVAPLFPFIYVVLRWRSRGSHEPGAGTYAALLYFCTAGLLLALAGAANLSYGFVSTTPASEQMTRLSWGMLVGSTAFFLVNCALVRLYGPAQGHMTARRVFVGFFMVTSGLVAFTTLVLFCITLFHKTEGDAQRALRADELKLYGMWTIYYLASYLASVVLLARGARGAEPVP
jgi:hypothetical protein